MDTSRKILIVSVFVTDVQLFLITIFHLTFEEGRYFCFAPFFFMQVCILSLMTQMNYPTFWLSWHLTQDTHSLHYKEIQKMYFHYKEISMYQNFCVQNSKKKISRTIFSMQSFLYTWYHIQDHWFVVNLCLIIKFTMQGDLWFNENTTFWLIYSSNA